MNKERKKRLRCVNCNFFWNDIEDRCRCEYKPEYVLDRFTRKPDWCPVDKAIDAINEVGHPQPIFRDELNTQVNINDFIPDEARGKVDQ